MHSDQQPYRELHDAMLDCRDTPFPAHRLAEWLRSYPDEVRWLDSFRSRSGPQLPASDEDLWRLYGLSRVIDLMNLSFQKGEWDTWSGPALPLNDVRSFAIDLGLTPLLPERYSAFDCEIVAATPAPDPNQPAALLDIQWLGLALGEMLVCRAGTTVQAGAAVVNPQIATSSTLYWAYRRRNRPHQDLSHGWGHNSQWRTRFRRDYRSGQQRFYNVDGRNDLAADDLPFDDDDDNTLTHSERVELLLNRSFVVTAKRSDDLWPYDDRLTVEDRPTGRCS